MGIRLFPSHREVRRAQARLVARFFATMAIVTVTFVFIVAVHYLLGWW
jgi:hypothetical protein